MTENWDMYKNFVPTDERSIYLQTLARENTWGDELAIRAFSEATGTRVHVHERAHPHAFIAEYGVARRSIILLFDGLHYDLATFI